MKISTIREAIQVVAISIFFCTASALLLYALFGHRLIEDMYQGKTIDVLNKIITGQKYHAVDHYLIWADIWIVKRALYTVFLCLFLLIPLNGKLLSLSILVSLMMMGGILKIYEHIYPDLPNDVDGALLWEHDPILGWKYAANSEGYFSSKNNGFRNKVRTNSKGLRDDEYTYKKDEGTRRILLLGDSVVAGFEVEREDVIDAQLEKLLNQEGKYQVINAGVRGYGTDQSYLFLKNEGYKYSPDIIIYVFVKNDLEDNITVHNPERKFGKSYFALDDLGQLTLQGVPVPKEFSPHDQWLMSDKTVERYYNQAESDPDDVSSILQSIDRDLTWFTIYKWFHTRVDQQNKQVRPEYVRTYENRILKALLERMKEEAHSINAEFLIYEWTNGTGRFPSAPTDLRNMADDLGIDYLNSFKEFYEVSGGGRVLTFPIDGHWNAKGHRLAAQSIYRYVVEKKWIADNSKTTP